MGIGMGGHSKYNFPGYDWRVEPSGNPDPTNYKIIRHEFVGDLLVLMVNYPDCTNYKGNKILVYRKTGLIDLINQRSLDPHFSEDKDMQYPIARFEPNGDGWQNALIFCKAVSSKGQ